MDDGDKIQLVERGPMSKSQADKIVDWLFSLDSHGRFEPGERGRWAMRQHHAFQDQVVLRIEFKNPEDYAMFRLTWS